MTYENKLTDDNKRVLGRVLAVEEVNAVAGARPTTPLWDQMTTKLLDSSSLLDNPLP